MNSTNPKWRFRWIDERLGIAELECEGNLARLDFKNLMITYKASRYVIGGNGTRPMMVLGNHLASGDDFGAPTPIFGPIVAEALMDYYSKWLNRVMLEEDDYDNEEGRDNDTGALERLDTPGVGKRGVGRSDDRDDSDKQRVPLRQNKGNFPVVSREHSWSTRPK